MICSPPRPCAVLGAALVALPLLAAPPSPPVVATEDRPDGIPGGAGPVSAPRDYEAMATEIVALVERHHHDPEEAREWSRLHHAFASGVDDDRLFSERARRALADLNISHTGYFTPDDPEHAALLAIYGPALGLDAVRTESIGAVVTPEGYVERVFTGGPAHVSGLQRGDHLLAADGVPFHPVLAFKDKAGRKIELDVLRRPGQAPDRVNVVPRLVDPRAEWMHAQERGARLIRVGPRTVGYMPMFSCAGAEFAGLLQTAIIGPFNDADALVLDFRGGWGGCNPDLVNLFSTLPPVLEQVGRDGVPREIDSQWRKPLVILIDGGTRSGKEVVAHAVRRHDLGVLVGERTAGAVSAGRVFQLADGSILYLAVAELRVDGERLEGAGVEPQVTVPAALEYAEGADPQLDRAVELAAEMAGMSLPRD